MLCLNTTTQQNRYHTAVFSLERSDVTDSSVLFIALITDTYHLFLLRVISMRVTSQPHRSRDQESPQKAPNYARCVLRMIYL